VALLGLPSAAPLLGLDNETVKDFVPEKGLALLIAIEKLLVAVSPFDHCRVPLAAVKSDPEAAVPPVVE